MSAFESGFKKYIEDSGLSAETAAHIFKRASDHPEIVESFKFASDSTIDANELDALSNMLHQHNMYCSINNK